MTEAVVVEATTRTPTTLSTVVHAGGRSYPLVLSGGQTLSPPSMIGDVWLPVVLFAAMAEGHPLRMHDAVSTDAVERCATAQKILSTWFSDYRPIEIHARSRRSRALRRGTAQLFTGGVDSFYTLTTHPEVSSIIYHHDAIHEPEMAARRAADLARDVAGDLSLRALSVHSNVRSLLDVYGEWGEQTHGAALGATALAAFGSQGVTLFPASHTYAELAPWGSHPLLDHLWGPFVHDGAEKTRSQKVAHIAQFDVALRNLRVCWRDPRGLNCGTCEKCVRTMLELELAGALDAAVTFTGEFTLDMVRSMEIRNDSDLTFAIDARDAAVRLGRVDLVEAQEVAINRFRARATSA